MERMGVDSFAIRLSLASRWGRVGHQAWGPMSTWLYLLQELGFVKVQGPLIWTLDAGNIQHPRKQDGAEWDLDMQAPDEARARAIRNAWRSRCWCKWSESSLRYDAGLARATQAAWQPA
eukprot:14986264-Alexandrium_andersonii.AAC.1